MNLKQLRPFLLTLFCAALVITGLTAIARAQSAPEAVSTTAAQTGSGFTFQGQLQDNGAPVNATCDIQAGLWDAETNGAQVGSTQTVTDVAVVDGRFTITLNPNNEFGDTAFTGQARWLQIAVRCPAGSGSYATLQPRQPLTAAPYAHGLIPGAVISGSIGTGTNAMLALSNLDAGGVGLRVFDTGLDGVFVDRAGRDGVYVGSAQQDGLFVCSTGSESGCAPQNTANGLEIGRAQDNGIFIQQAGEDGIYICNEDTAGTCSPNGFSDGIEIDAAAYTGVLIDFAPVGLDIVNAATGIQIGNVSFDGVRINTVGNIGFLALNATLDGFYTANAGRNGLTVGNAGFDGVSVGSASGDGFAIGTAGENGVEVNSSTNAFWAGIASADGLYVQSAGYNGVDVTGANLAGFFGGAVQITGGCTGCLLANFGINSGQTPLEPGDVVVLTGSQLSRVDSTPMLLEVAQASGNGAVVGVVMGRAEEVTLENPRPDELGTRLIPREGPAQPGEFVTIVTYGLAPVRVGTANTSLTIGQRLTAGENGMARTLQTVEVNGVTLNEAAPTLGIALEAGDVDGDGLVWVLVNPN